MARHPYRLFRSFWYCSRPLSIIPIGGDGKRQNRVSRMKLVGFNMDFNEPILRRIYNSLTRYEYLDENRTSFLNFYEVMVMDFNDHGSVMYFSCTQPQLKYILDKFKQLKKGVSLKSFERSQKIYHKGNLIAAETLSKKYKV